MYEKEIKFSHEYMKFPCTPPFKAILLQCFQTHYNELSEVFKEYDTTFVRKDTFSTGHYQLPKTDLIVLLLQFGEYTFTTIRRYTDEKWEYYIDNIGKEFKIVKV